MSLRRFLYCAYAMLVEAYQSVGADLLSAVEKVNASLGLSDEALPVAQAERIPTPAENARAMEQLQRMLGGLSV